MNATRNRSHRWVVEGVRAYAVRTDLSGPMAMFRIYHEASMQKQSTHSEVRDSTRTWRRMRDRSGNPICRCKVHELLCGATKLLDRGHGAKGHPCCRLQPLAADIGLEESVSNFRWPCSLFLLTMTLVGWVSQHTVCPFLDSRAYEEDRHTNASSVGSAQGWPCPWSLGIHSVERKAAAMRSRSEWRVKK